VLTVPEGELHNTGIYWELLKPTVEHTIYKADAKFRVGLQHIAKLCTFPLLDFALCTM
jgi:hypothetical protein